MKGKAMKRLERRWLVYLLVSFLLVGLLAVCLPPNTSDPEITLLIVAANPEQAFLPNNGNLTTTTLWKNTQDNANPTQSLTSFNRLIRHKSFIRNHVTTACLSQNNTLSREREFSQRVVHSLNTFSDFINGQACQFVDLPPPVFEL